MHQIVAGKQSNQIEVLHVVHFFPVRTMLFCDKTLFFFFFGNRRIVKVFDMPYNGLCPPLFLMNHCSIHLIQSIGKLSNLPTFSKRVANKIKKKSLPCQKLFQLLVISRQSSHLDLNFFIQAHGLVSNG